MKVKALTSGLKSLKSVQLWKDAGWIAGGGVLTPLFGAVVVGLTARVTGKQAMPTTGLTGLLVKGLSAIGVAVLGQMVFKSAKVGQLLAIGGMSAVVSDIANERLLPMIGLSDFLTAEELSTMSDYLTLPPAGMGEYATAPEVAESQSGRTHGEAF